MSLTTAQWLRRRAALTPERTAITELESGRAVRYRELVSRAHRLAHALRDRLGVRAGDRVAILAHNDPAHVDLLVAASAIGAIAVPLNWRLAGPELAAIAEDCEPRVLLAGDGFVDLAHDVGAWAGIEHVVAVDSPAYRDLVAAGSEAAPALPALTGDDPACLLYTSGTTGRAKGVIIPHRQILWNCINTAVSWGLRETDVTPIFTPLFHAGGLFAFLTPVLYLGGRVVLARGVTGDDDLRAIERERCTVILGVPTIFQMWRDARAHREVDYGSVRFFATGGAPCPLPLLRAWSEETGAPLRQGYGLTEVGPNCFAMTDAEASERAGTVGRPCVFGDIALVDEDGRAVADGEVGELALRGPHVCAGYWRAPQATAAALRDGWFHTGDLARRDADGMVSIVGRRKEMIISGGENIYAAEVEAVFAEHPAVAEAALIGRADERWGEVGVMVVIPRPGAVTSEGELLGFCDGRLARYKIPKQVVFADDFPRTALGKPHKPTLRRSYGGQA